MPKSPDRRANELAAVGNGPILTDRQWAKIAPMLFETPSAQEAQARRQVDMRIKRYRLLSTNHDHRPTASRQRAALRQAKVRGEAFLNALSNLDSRSHGLLSQAASVAPVKRDWPLNESPLDEVSLGRQRVRQTIEAIELLVDCFPYVENKLKDRSPRRQVSFSADFLVEALITIYEKFSGKRFHRGTKRGAPIHFLYEVFLVADASVRAGTIAEAARRILKARKAPS
jgi:hypothetical protein